MKLTGLNHNEQRTVAIAEAFGWSGIEDLRKNFMLAASLIGYPPRGAVIGQKVPIPNYFASLDAMHEAESAIEKNITLYSMYWKILHGLETNEECTGHWCDLKATGHASSEQRAEALGRALNLW